ncbi:acyltransferase [Perlabentimonas gracilis]|uniref:acyltransferase n=1 Tax=Perlabentimonas gracilis TaxID=2715279 RepID=UPI0014072D73|nr:acyltransferase [Perlabentimonas gracilis]NHB70197.1 acyltransferase [Perlabentimonas gracilis]
MLRRILDLIKYLFLSPSKYAKSIGVQVGVGCYISTKKFSSEPYLIKIGSNVRISRGVSFYTHGGIWPFRKVYPELDYFGKIVIGNNCYIGEDVKIMPGVTVEDNCIVGAGTILTKSVIQGTVVAGNPAKYVGETKEFLEKIKKYNCKTKGLSYFKKRQLLLTFDDNSFVKKDWILRK